MDPISVASTAADRPITVEEMKVLKNWPRCPENSSRHAVSVGSKSTKGR